MSRLPSPRGAGSEVLSAALPGTATSSSSPPNQHLSPRPAASVLDVVVESACPAASSPALSASQAPSFQLLLPAAVARLPSLDLPLYSSTALCAPYGAPTSEHLMLSQPPQAPPARAFFSSSHAGSKRPRALKGRDNLDTQAALSARAASTSVLLSYCRHLPSESIAESLRGLLWPHKPTSHTPQSRATYLSLLPHDEQQDVEHDVEHRLAIAAKAVLAVLEGLDELSSRPYDMALHRIRPSQWQLPDHPLLPALVAPLLSSMGLLRDREEWVVGDKGVDEVKLKVKQARMELDPLVADTVGLEDAQEAWLLSLERGERQPALEDNADETGREHLESKYDNCDDVECSVRPVALARHKSLHPAAMPVRPMPTMPTVARHSRSTFKAASGRSNATQRPPSAGQRADAGDVSYSSGGSEALAHPKPLSFNVAGDRRTLPVALPRTFLSSAPVIGATGGGPALFTVQPAVLDVGPLLVGCTYTASVLLTNCSSSYSRFEVTLSPSPGGATSPSLQSHSPVSLSFAFRRGGLSAGLSKPLTAIIACAAAGSFDKEVLVMGEAGSVRLSVCGECMADAEQWRYERTQRDSLSSGELGITLASALPGSLKQVQSFYGRVKEESKEQILTAAVLSRWRNRALHS